MNVNTREKVILFTCTWHAYSSLVAAGGNRSTLPVDVVPIRLPCLGRISTGIILKTFEQGAAGVLLLGCPENQCHYQTGNQEVLKVLQETKDLLNLLGYGEGRLAYQQLPAESGVEFLGILTDFLDKLQNGRDQS